MADRIKNEVTILGSDVIGMVLRQLRADRENLRVVGKSAASDLIYLVKDGHVKVQLRVPEGDSLDEEDFSITFSYDVSFEEYAESTAQLLCVVCGEWSAFTKELDEGEVCDLCRAKRHYDGN